MYRENAWLKYDQKELKNVMKFADGYKEFLSFGKTERLVTKESVELLEKYGFKNAALEPPGPLAFHGSVRRSVA